MTDDFEKNAFIRGLFRRLVFMTFGIVAYSNPMNRLSISNIVFGAFMGLIFSGLCKIFISGMLSIFNPTLRKEKGRKTIKHAVDHGMMYMIPFAMMSVVASFYLGWTLTSGFFSTAMMTAGGIAVFEVGRLRGKPAIKNTIVASVLSYVFSTLWMMSMPFLVQVPGLIDGGITLLKSMSGSILK